MAVRYHRECIDGQWLEFRFSDEELNKLRRATARGVIKCLRLVKEEAAAAATDPKEPMQLSAAEVLVVAQKVAPTYADVVSDYIRNKVWVKNHPEAAKAAAQPEVAANPK